MTNRPLAMTFLALILAATTAPAATEDIHAGNITRIDRQQYLEEAQQDFFPNPSADSRLDPYSIECLICHDGGIAAATHFTGGATRTLNSHPVGVPLPRRHDFTPPLAGSNIVLIDGRVSCVSCHDMDNGGAHLASDNSNSRLCFTCHLK